MNIKKDIRFRVYIAFTGICLFGIAIVFKAGLIQVKDGPKLRAVAHEINTRFDTLLAERGNIYNEDGVLLSSSIPEFDVHIDFKVIDSGLFAKNIDSLSACLSHLFNDKTPAQYKEELVNAYEAENTYYLLRRKLKYNEYEALRSFPIFNKKRGIGGFIAEARKNRVNPYDIFALRTIGLFRDTNASGLEATYNKVLAGENGSRESQKYLNVWIPIDSSVVEPHNGKDIVTTLDMNIQRVAENAVMEILTKDECKYGTCIVMEVSTGKIRALVNLGKIDSVNGHPVEGVYGENFNYAMIPTEPGSTFKLVTLLSLLNDKYVTVDDLVDAHNGALTFGNRTMKDSHSGFRDIPIWKAYAISSNVAMASLAYKYYGDKPSKFVNHLFALHLDKPTGIDLLGERPTKVIKPGTPSWSNTTLPWMATGYGVLISPLHTCMMYNAIANNGKMMKPYLVSAIKEYGQEVKTFAPQVIEQVGDSAVVAQLQRCMRAVVTEGTAKGIESPYYTMAGKTGTAQVADKGIRYTDHVYQGSFVGYLPADKPKYTVCVVIRTKANSHEYYGAALAAPVFREVADKIFAGNIGAWAGPLDSLAQNNTGKIPAKAATARSYQVLLDAVNKHTAIAGDYVNTLMALQTDSNKHITVSPAKMYRNIVPDVTGMGLKDAVYILETSGLQVQVQGKGKVHMQSIAPGSTISKGQNIILQLS